MKIAASLALVMAIWLGVWAVRDNMKNFERMQRLSIASTYEQMYHLEDAENLDGEAGVAAGAFLVTAVALFSVKSGITPAAK
jgi:hypothetical protein